jgi:hypothetical protein
MMPGDIGEARLLNYFLENVYAFLIEKVIIVIIGDRARLNFEINRGLSPISNKSYGSARPVGSLYSSCS